MRAKIAALVISCAASSSAFACDEQQIAAQIAATWKPQIDAASGTCQTADVMIRMLRDSKSKIAKCLVGNLKRTAMGDLDRSISQWKQTKSDACG